MDRKFGIIMRFIADNMLGKLSKWLRFLGYDTLYPKTIDDKELVKLSRSEDRILLTRDKELVKMKNLKALYIKSEKLDEQLKQIIKEFDLKMSSDIFTRCPECNYILAEVDKSLLNGKVPEGVLQRQDMFWLCEKCSRYYWQGTHYLKINSKLEELFK